MYHQPAVHGALVDDEVGHQKLAMARHQQALRLQLVVLELLELQEGPALQVHELVLSVRRALAGVQGLVASEGRVELDEMALELGRRHIAVVLQNPSRRELWRRRFVCCNKAVVWPAWSCSAPSNWPSASRHREASPCQACTVWKHRFKEKGIGRRNQRSLRSWIVEPEVRPALEGQTVIR